MIETIKKLLGRSYHPLNKIQISKTNLIYNYKFLSKRIKIAPVLKSNAYGHGIVEVAKILDPLFCPFYCVDSIFEAYQIFKAGIKTKVLIMGYINPDNLKVKKLPFAYAIWDLEIAQTLNKHQKGCEIHIFVDTGMGREGIRLEELKTFLIEIKQFKDLNIVGLMSHLASADDVKNTQNKFQIRNFKKALQICKQAGLKLRYIHLDNSDGLANFKIGNVARSGMALYGTHPSLKNLKPVLEFSTTLVQIKKIHKNDRVGYSGTFKAKKGATLGILPVGYNDGVDRRLSNKGTVTIQGISCPIIGQISMNVTTIDLSKLDDPKIGDEAVIYSANRHTPNYIGEVAKLCKTVVYDILVKLTPTTRREVI